MEKAGPQRGGYQAAGVRMEERCLGILDDTSAMRLLRNTHGGRPYWRSGPLAALGRGRRQKDSPPQPALDSGYSLPARWLRKRSRRYHVKGRPEESRHATGDESVGGRKQASLGRRLRHESSGAHHGSFPFIFCWHCRERFRWMQRQLPAPASPW